MNNKKINLFTKPNESDVAKRNVFLTISVFEIYTEFIDFW